MIATVVSALEHSANMFDRDCRRADFERRVAGLTPREREILSHLVVGKANKVVAYDLGISERTLYRKLREVVIPCVAKAAIRLCVAQSRKAVCRAWPFGSRSAQRTSQVVVNAAI